MGSSGPVAVTKLYCDLFPILEKSNHPGNIFKKLLTFAYLLYLGEWSYNLVNKYMAKVSNRNNRRGCEIGSELTIKTPIQNHWRYSGVITVDCEHT